MKRYLVKTISDRSEISECETASVGHFMWTNDYKPQCEAKIGYIPGEELVIKFTVVESEPLCVYHENEEPVYMDSAVEAFMSFGVSEDKYMNLEVNSYGAMLAHFGVKGDRKKISDISGALVEREAKMAGREWSVTLYVPCRLISDLFGHNESPSEGFRFNLYKICSTKGREHYASFAPIESDYPDFHRPDCFAEAIIAG